MTKLYLTAGTLDDRNRHALLSAANQRLDPAWKKVPTGSRDTVLSGPGHFIKLLAPTLLSRASSFAPARLLATVAGRGARLARREQRMNLHGFSTAPIVARGLVGNREFLVTTRVEGETLHALAPLLTSGDKRLLVQTLSSVIAEMHSKGIYHGDLNSHNIIVATGSSYTFVFLDNGSTRIQAREISNRQALRNLSQLNFWLSSGALYRTDRLRFLKIYLTLRGRLHMLPEWWKELIDRFSKRMRRKQEAA